MSKIGFFYKDYYLLKVEIRDDIYPHLKDSYKYPDYGLYYTKNFIILSITDMKTKMERTSLKKYKVNHCYMEKDTFKYYKLEEVALSAVLMDYIKKGYFNVSGEFKSYHDNGEVKLHYYHNNGIIDGEYLEYTNEGILIRNLYYVNGKVCEN